MSQPIAASADAGTVVRKLLEALETLEVESLRAVLHLPYVEVYGIQDDLIRWIDVYPQDAARLTEFMNAEG
jgi:hypothetical protein